MTPATDHDALVELTARLRRLEDLLEIQQLFVDYGRHLDARDFDAYARLFADDGEVLLGPVGRATGPAAIKELMERALGGSAPSVHLVTSPMIELDGDRARSSVMWTVLHQGDDGVVASMVGRHEDDLVREDGRWKFRRRRGYVDIPAAITGA